VRLRRNFAVGVAGLLLAVSAFGAWLVSTERGTSFIVSRGILGNVPELGIGHAGGTVLRGIELADLRYSSEGVNLTVDRLMIELAPLELLRAQVVIRNLYVSPVSVELSATSAGQPGSSTPIASPLGIPATPVDIVLESAVIEGISIVDGDAVTSFGQLIVSAVYAGTSISVSRFDARYQGFSISAQARVQGANAIAVDGTISVAGEIEERDLLASLDLNGTLPNLQIEAQLLEPFPVEARGRVALEDVPAFVLELSWDQFGAQELGIASGFDWRFNQGTANLAGTPADISYTVATAVDLDGLPYGLSLAGDYAFPTAVLTNLTLESGDANLNLRGAIDVSTLDFQSRVAARNLNPGQIMADWDGELQLDGDITGRFGGALEVISSNLRFDGVIRGYPVLGSIAGTYRGNNDIDVASLELNVGSNLIEASGRIADTVSVSIVAGLRNVAQIVENIDGALTADVAITGTLADPIVDGSVMLENFSYAGSSVERLTVSGRVGLRPDSPLDIAINAELLVAGRLPVDSLDANFEGTVVDHQLNIGASAATWAANGTAQGAADGRGWQGAIENAQIDREPLGSWQLKDSVALTIADTGVSLDYACLAQQTAELCAELSTGGAEPEALRMSATDIDIALFQPFLPATFAVSGIYQMNADLRDFSSNPVGALTVSGGRTRLALVAAADADAEMTLTSLNLDASFDGSGIAGSLQLVGSASDQLSAELEVIDLNDADAPIAGVLNGQWSDLAPFSLLSPNIGAVGGSLGASLVMSGSLSAPQFDGRAEWRNGSVELPTWGVTANEISAAAVSPDGSGVDFDGTARIDGSELRLAGTTLLDSARGWPTRLTLSGENVPLVQTADADILVSPDLEINVDLPNIDVRGTVNVPKALVTIKEIPAQAVRPSPDSIVHGVEEVEQSPPIALSADIAILLGEDVRYEGAGLTADVTGALRLRYTTPASVNASGSLSLVGLYEAFGQELTLERGELVFTGPIDNPTLNVRAIRRVDPVTVGVDLTGSVDAPVTRIFSEPAMGEADALSYLLFGRPLAAPDNDDPDQLRNAAVALGLRQAVPVIQRIGSSLGFDEFAIESTDVDAGALMAGKFLSPKLYVRYSYGLFNRIGGLLVQYRLNDRVSIETLSGDQKSMDVLYTIERD
jgi:translocation and assembly module TamB